jgi:hypothetical protein
LNKWKGKGIMSIILSVLHSPKKTFEYIRENGGGFLIPFIAIIVATIAVAFIQLPIVERAFDLQMTENPAIEDSGMSVETFKTIAVYTSLIMTPVMVAAMTFITALLLLLVNLIARGEAKYMDLVKVSVLSSIPTVINGILTGILVRTSDASNVNELVLSLGAFMEQKEGIAFGLANLVNPFGLWGLALMVIGTAVMARRSMKSVGIWIVAGYIIISLPFALLA